MEKARIIGGVFFGGIHQNTWLENNKNVIFAGELVSEWHITENLPNTGIYKPIWDGDTWVESATEAEINQINRQSLPKVVSQRQLRTQLVLGGFDLNDIQDAINGLSEPNKSIAQIAWNYALTFVREDDLLVSVGASLGLTESQIDEIFLNASNL